MSSDRTTAKVTPVVPKDGQDRKLKPPPPDQHVKCPRCDSPNTKFCYYNNYSLSQPRHFCKTCRRYWTKGGALRNVPIGGGCRKNKKMKQRLAGTLDPRDSSSCEIMGSIGGGHNFFQGFLTPAMDFQLGSINPPSISSSMFLANGVDTNFSLYEPHHNTSHLRSTTHHPISSNSVATLMRCGRDELAGTLQMGTDNNNNSMIVHSNLASSIESLSSINQELHWKLQQERLAAVLFPGDQSEKRSVQSDLAQVEHQAFDHHHHQPQGQTQKFLLQPILFQNLETTKEADHHPYSTSESIMDGPEVPRKGNNGGGNNSTATEWFLDANPYTNGRSNNNRGLNDDQGNNTMNQQAGDDIHHNNWNSTEIQAWSDMQQFSGALP